MRVLHVRHVHMYTHGLYTCRVYRGRDVRKVRPAKVLVDTRRLRMYTNVDQVYVRKVN